MAAVKVELTACGRLLAAAMEADGLKVSVKSVVVASTRSLSREISRQLTREGVGVREAPTVKDLGVDSGAGKRRPRPTLKNRLRNAQLRHFRGVSIRRAAGRRPGKKIFMAGTFPSAMYAASAFGPAPTRLRRIRTMAAEAGGYGGFGRCTTSSLGLGYPHKDPAITLVQS